MAKQPGGSCVVDADQVAAGEASRATAPQASAPRRRVCQMCQRPLEPGERKVHGGRCARDRKSALQRLRRQSQAREPKGVAVNMAQAPECPNSQNHTPCPAGYLAWRDWAKTMTRTHRQTRCPVCTLWVIWKQKRPRGKRT